MSKIQSVEFNKNFWNILSAHQWLINHNIYPVKSPDVTDKFIHFRIRNPSQFKRIRTIKTKDNLNIIIGFK